jgi:hypothetical protein
LPPGGHATRFILRGRRPIAAFSQWQSTPEARKMHVVTFATEPAVRGACEPHRANRAQIGIWSLVAYLLLVLAAWSAPSPEIGDAPPQPEHGIKAAFLYKFLGYVEWPAGVLASPTAPIVIGVLGADDIADELQTIVARRRIAQHPIEVRRVREADALDALNVLFIGRDATSALRRLAPAAHERSVLLVSDVDGGLEEGSVINLVVVDNRVRFEVSLEAAERSQLKLSSRMLAVAMWVRPAR